MPVSFSDVQLAFEFVSSGGMGENEAYLECTRWSASAANPPPSPPFS